MERDAVRCRIRNHLICKAGNKVIAVTPLSYIEDIRHLCSDITKSLVIREERSNEKNFIEF